MSVQKMTRIAFFSAILCIAKVILEFLPNVELVSFLVIIYALVFGREALWMVLIFDLYEGLQWGFGVWWISYLYVWPLLAILTLCLKRLLGEEFLLWAVVSGVFGLCFGGLFALAYLPVDPAYAFSYFLSGLLWDVWHSVCNFILMAVAGKPVYLAIQRVRQRSHETG